MPPERDCEQLAADQHGVLSRRQALAAGMSRRAITGRVSSGRWRVVHTGVYVPRPVPSSWHQRLMAAVLCGGESAVASHRSAAALWCLDGVERPHPEISIRAGRRIEGVIVHRRRPSDDPPVTVIDRIPVTGIERTLLDLAGVMPTLEAGRALDDALRRRLTKISEIRRMLLELPKGRAGRRMLRRLIEDRDEHDALLESRLEAALLHVLRKHGVEAPVPQFEVRDGSFLVGRVDFAYPSRRIGIEADGYRWHASPERWRRDLRRENRLKLLGWTLLRFTWEDVHDRPELVASQVRAALAEARGIDRRRDEPYTPSRMTELQPRT